MGSGLRQALDIQAGTEDEPATPSKPVQLGSGWKLWNVITAYRQEKQNELYRLYSRAFFERKLEEAAP